MGHHHHHHMLLRRASNNRARTCEPKSPPGSIRWWRRLRCAPPPRPMRHPRAPSTPALCRYGILVGLNSKILVGLNSIWFPQSGNRFFVVLISTEIRAGCLALMQLLPYPLSGFGREPPCNRYSRHTFCLWFQFHYTRPTWVPIPLHFTMSTWVPIRRNSPNQCHLCRLGFQFAETAQISATCVDLGSNLPKQPKLALDVSTWVPFCRNSPSQYHPCRLGFHFAEKAQVSTTRVDLGSILPKQPKLTQTQHKLDPQACIAGRILSTCTEKRHKIIDRSNFCPRQPRQLGLTGGGCASRPRATQ